MLEALDGYLDRMVSITISAERGLPDTPPTDTIRLDRSRLEMARILTAYQLFAHRELFQPLLTSKDPLDVICAREMKVECIALAEDFRIYTRKWSVERPLDLWTVYQPEALGMIRRIRQHAFRVRRGARRLMGDDAAISPEVERSQVENGRMVVTKH